MPIPITQLIAKASELYRVPESDILGTRRFDHFAKARAAVALAAYRGGWTYVDIGLRLGGRHFSTIMSACKRAESLCVTDKHYRKSCEALIEMAHDFTRRNKPFDVGQRYVNLIKRRARDERRALAEA